MPRIHRLSQSLINKIAAGEVVERPASVVRELMENAVDAGARRVDVTVQGGGVDLVRVVDDGCGIAADELPMAVASHATSKLTEAEDLFSIATLGFRGEALASIAEVSRTVLRSRTPESESGAEIEITGGDQGDVAPCGCPVGTSVEVHNLFYNTPVRRKFLRTTQTEFGHVSEAFTRIALGTANVHFTLRHNDRQVFDLASSDGWIERIARFFGRELAEGLIPVESTDNLPGGGQVRLSGYVAAPAHSRANNRMQYVFLNGRYIRDRALQHALGEAYRGLLMTRRYPIAFLTLEMPPEMVDVNVHPTKLEVRFQDSGRLYSQLLSALRTKFLATDLSAHVSSSSEEDQTGGHDEARAEQLRQELVDWAKGKVESWDTAGGSRTAAEAAFDVGAAAGGRQPLEMRRIDHPGRSVGEAPAERTVGPLPAVSEEGAENASGLTAGVTHTPVPQPPVPTSAVQIHNRYLVTESERGITVIDQHALHERILYEHLRERVDAGVIETQNLLVPEPVDLAADEVAAVLENRELLSELGMEIEPFGGDTVLIAGFPAMLANFRPVEVLHELIGKLLAGGKKPDRRDLLDAMLHAIACKAAVKAGDRLAPEEIKTLLDQRHIVNDPHHCPHGRPTELIFTHEELEKQFKRT